MNDLKEIKLNDTIYVRKEDIKNIKGTGIFREVEYACYIWNVISEDNESLTLLMKNCLEINGDTKFMAFNSDDDECIWWKNSAIRKYLNNDFIKKLNKADLLPMTTEVWLNGESSTTVDKVRLLTIEEIFRIPKNVLSKGYWYWSLSPYCMSTGGYAYVFNVNTSGDLSYNGVIYTSGAVAPVIKLKRCVLEESN